MLNARLSSDPVQHASRRQNLLGAVSLYEDTWLDHIIVRHPELNGRLSMVEETVLAPTAIFASTSVAGSYLLVRNGMVDRAGRLLRVVVGMDRSVRSAYFSSAAGGTQLWP
jgi:hypothetical protein